MMYFSTSDIWSIRDKTIHCLFFLFTFHEMKSYFNVKFFSSIGLSFALAASLCIIPGRCRQFVSIMDPNQRDDPHDLFVIAGAQTDHYIH